MPERSEFRLSRIDASVSAEYHNPSMLTPDFLRLSGIVPAHWEEAEAGLSRDFSSVLFYNGILWAMNQERLIIEDSREGLSFSEPFEVHGLARRYLEEVRAVPYRNLVLSFHGWASIPSCGGDPRRWLAERLLRPDKLNAHPSGLMMEPRLLFNISGTPVRLTMTRPESDVDEGGGEAVGLRARVLYQGSVAETDIRESGGPLLSGLEKWPDDQSAMLEVVRNILAKETIC